MGVNRGFYEAGEHVEDFPVPPGCAGFKLMVQRAGSACAFDLKLYVSLDGGETWGYGFILFEGMMHDPAQSEGDFAEFGKAIDLPQPSNPNRMVRAVLTKSAPDTFGTTGAAS